MAIKNFILKDSYSRIERVDVMKDTETLCFYLTVYKDNTCIDIIVKDMRFACINNAMDRHCLCENVKVLEDGSASICEVCNGTKYIAKNEYNYTFKEALRQDLNIFGVCYNYLMTKPEFINTEEI